MKLNNSVVKWLVLIPSIVVIAASCNSKQASEVKPTVSGTFSQDQVQITPPDNNSATTNTSTTADNSDTQKIADLQKQVDDLKKQNTTPAKIAAPKPSVTPTQAPAPTPTPTLVQTDFCPNISGAQEAVPQGMVIDNNRNCVVPPPVIVNNPPPPVITPQAPTPSQADLDHIARLQIGNSVLSQINAYLPGLNSQISSLNSQLQDLQKQIDNVIPSCSAGGCTQSQVDGLTNNLKVKYNAIVPTYNNLLQIKSRLATIIYEVTDYTSTGILPPAADRAYLLQLGISWPIN